MKYPGDNVGEQFCDQFNSVLSFFDKFNDCEKTVVLCALLKQVPATNLKLLQLLNEHNLTNAYNAQSKLPLLERNANNVAFLNELTNRYRNLSDVLLKEDNCSPFIKKHEKKEEILHEILVYLPLLIPGNNETKTFYLNLIPMIVSDCSKQIVSTELVQQVFSYLLIHPAITCDDRKLVSQWLRHLQGQLSPDVIKPPTTNTRNFLLPVESYLASSTSSLTSSSWQIVAPPTTENTHWDMQHIKITQEFCNELADSLSNSVGSISSNSSHVIQRYEKSVPGILKNGRDSFDFGQSSLKHGCNIGFLKVPKFDINDKCELKTRRSHSLTTSTPQTTRSSVENLGNVLQKPRSFSLSIENPCEKFRGSASDSRLEESCKPFLKFNSTHNVGMSNVGHWLKSLRLHKYMWLFSDLTYEQMLDITEEYLESLGVTKGARHKLVLCIQKLKERTQLLKNIEKDLLKGTKPIQAVLDEITVMVLSPMKPIDMYSPDDVAGHIFKIIDYIASWIIHNESQIHDDTTNVTLWILEKLLHNEAFVAQTNQIRDYKFKLSKMRSHCMTKNHYPKKVDAKNAANKPRYQKN